MIHASGLTTGFAAALVVGLLATFRLPHASAATQATESEERAV